MTKTVEQISKALGVSITTVRFVINGSAQKHRVSTATINKVETYIAEHGLQLNHAARSLKLQRSYTFGLIVPRLTNPFFAHLAESLEGKCREEGYQLITVCSNSDEDAEKSLLSMLLQRGVDGIFAVSGSMQVQEFLLRTSKLPVVAIDRNYGVEGLPCITSDNFKGACMLCEALDAHTEPLPFLVGGALQPTILDRLNGYKYSNSEVEKSALERMIFSAPRNTVSDGRKMMANLLESSSDAAPRGIITSSLPVLQGALGEMRDRLGHIPVSMSIGTFDDDEMLEFLPNQVFAIRQNETQIALAAFTAMEAAQKGEPPISTIVPVRLVQRCA